MTRQLNWKLGLTSAVCALVLVGCGGGDDATPATLATPATPVGVGGTASLTYATSIGGAATPFMATSITVEDSGLADPTNRITLLGTGGGFEREIKIYVKDSDCSVINIAHAWAGTAADLLGPTAISTFVSNPVIGPTFGLEPANNTITFNDTVLDGNAPDVSTLKGTVKPGTKVCASAVV